MIKIVLGYGPKPCDVMMVGEKPGQEEARCDRPFVGASGREQENFLNFFDLTSKFWYLTNLDKEYREGNPDPTTIDIDRWSETLDNEIKEVCPKLIIAVGRFATQWFLGEDAEMRTVHGILCRAGEFDKSRRGRSNGAYVLPIYHPAGGLHETSMRGVIGWDYSRVARALGTMERNLPLSILEYAIVDKFEGDEIYEDTTGRQLYRFLYHESRDHRYIGIDTEGVPGDAWSIQVCVKEGTGFVLRRRQPDFDIGIKALQDWIGHPEDGTVIVAHNAPYDITLSLEMGLDLRRHTIFDPMYAAYLLRVEPQALSALSWRLFRGRKVSFKKFVGKAAREKQVRYLAEVVAADIDAPEPFDKYENDGSYKPHKPKSISSLAHTILKDMDIDGTRRGPALYGHGRKYKKDGTPYKKPNKILVQEGPLSGPKRDKDGNPPDPEDRWKAIYSTKRLTETGLPAEPMTIVAERLLGPMPVATLDDMPLPEAVEYAARDADYALRAVEPLTCMMKDRGVYELFKRRMKVVEPFRETQRNGLLADRDGFVDLSISMAAEMKEIRERLSAKYFEGRPINPISSKNVGELLSMQGLEAKKTMKKFRKVLITGEQKEYGGGPSTAKDSIEHYKYTNEAIDWVFRWRNVQHDLDSFVVPSIRQMDAEGPRFQYITCEMATTRTPNTRLRCKNPGLQAIPTRRGPHIRNCYTCEKGETLVSADLAQIEWRVAAQLSQDQGIIAEIVSGIDTHTALASKVFDVSFDEVDKKTQRTPAKTVRFLMNYGGSAGKLQDELWKLGLTWTIGQCEQILEDVMNANEALRDFIKSVIDDTHRTGIVRDHWGMMNYLWPSKDPKVRAENGRQAWSYMCSGTAQGCIQNSMAWLRDRVWEMVDAGIDVKWRLQLHDELIFSCPEDYAELLGKLIVISLTEHHGCKDWSVPIRAEWTKAKTWGELK